MEVLRVKRPKIFNRDGLDYIQPGPVGVIGNPNMQVELRNNTSAHPIIYLYPDDVLKHKGSGITDGDSPNEHTDGLGNNILIDDYNSNPIITQEVGDQWTAVDPHDLATTTFTKDVPDLNWRLFTAQSRLWGTQGPDFQPLPNGYEPQGLSRGPEPTTTYLNDATGENITSAHQLGASIHVPSRIVAGKRR